LKTQSDQGDNTSEQKGNWLIF